MGTNRIFHMLVEANTGKNLRFAQEHATGEGKGGRKAAAPAAAVLQEQISDSEGSLPTIDSGASGSESSEEEE